MDEDHHILMCGLAQHAADGDSKARVALIDEFVTAVDSGKSPQREIMEALADVLRGVPHIEFEDSDNKYARAGAVAKTMGLTQFAKQKKDAMRLLGDAQLRDDVKRRMNERGCTEYQAVQQIAAEDPRPGAAFSRIWRQLQRVAK